MVLMHERGSGVGMNDDSGRGTLHFGKKNHHANSCAVDSLRGDKFRAERLSSAGRSQRLRQNACRVFLHEGGFHEDE